MPRFHDEHIKVYRFAAENPNATKVPHRKELWRGRFASPFKAPRDESQGPGRKGKPFGNVEWALKIHAREGGRKGERAGRRSCGN